MLKMGTDTYGFANGTARDEKRGDFSILFVLDMKLVLSVHWI